MLQNHYTPFMYLRYLLGHGLEKLTQSQNPLKSDKPTFKNPFKI